MSTKEPKKTMIDQFNRFVEIKRKSKANNPKGPIDVKALRATVSEWNKKNRIPS